MIVYGEKSKEYLDYAALDKHGAHIDIHEVALIDAVTGLYFVRPKSLRLVWNYICDIGFKNTFIKIISRFAEKERNKKYLLIGRGECWLENGKRKNVIFIAPKHPAFPTRVWLPEPLFTATKRGDLSGDYQVRKLVKMKRTLREDLSKIAGWDYFSEELPPVINWPILEQLLVDSELEESFALDKSSLKTRSSIMGNIAHNKHTATLFGLGNYAKTIIMPSLPKEIVINRIHEVDPLQIPKNSNIQWDSSPTLSIEDENNTVFIAGYHHTHNELACDALNRHKSVVVEKPLVVNQDQLEKLSQAFKQSKGSYFSCFHKRYSLFNNLALADLSVIREQDPVNYHCIAYEAPLPDKHWYRWESSSTRIISNGCHWIDHFLHLNGYSEPLRIDCSEAVDGTISVFMELYNGACFTMALTEIGSEKIGVQDHIELRRGDVTIKIINGSNYISESKDRVLRKKAINKITSYRNMYASIGDAILAGGKGDSWEHTKISSETVLKVNEIIEARRLK